MMKGHKFSAVAAVLAATAFLGCSADQSGQPGKGVAGEGPQGSMSFKLLSSGNVQIDSISYDVVTSGGTDVVQGSIPVPSDVSQHVPVLGVQSLTAPADYTLQLSASGKLPDGTTVPCTSPKTAFHVNSGANTFIGDLPLTCSVTTAVDTHGSATADVTVTTVTTSQDNVVETFAYGPRSVSATKNGSTCMFPPIAIKVANTNTAVTYAAPTATPDGTFTMNAAKTEGTYNCASDGDKTLTVTGTLNGVTSSKSVTVHCDAAPCNFQCGNGIVEPGEQCDDTTARCQACHIVAVCGDGFIDGNECEPPNTLTCSATCTPITGCGNGIKEGTEACDNGSANSNTAPNACRTNCTLPSCGDNVVDTGEQCDPPNGSSCTATCQTGQVLDSTVCIPCIRASASDGSTQVQYCDSDPKCLTVEACEIDQKCFDPVPFNCYCGTNDTTACQVPTFVPTGKCLNEIKAGSTATDNAGIIQGMQGFDVASGVATSILNDAFATAPQCHASCF